MSDNSPKHTFPHDEKLNIFDALHQEHWHLTKLLVLLVVICVASLGSVSLAQNFLPVGPVVTATPTGYTDGQCDANPAAMHYITLNSQSTPSNSSPTLSKSSPTSSKTFSATPSPNANRKKNSLDAFHATNGFHEPGATTRGMIYQSSADPQVLLTKTPTPPSPTPTPTPIANDLPGDWNTDGFTADDARYARACAGLFVQLYHSYNFADPKTYESALYMTSKHAQQLFYDGGSDDANHIHLRMLPIVDNTSWQKTAHDEQLISTASVALPIIHDITPSPLNGSLYIVTVKVSYNLDKLVDSVPMHSTPTDTITLQTMLKPSSSLPGERVGWQVTNWIDGDA